MALTEYEEKTHLLERLDSVREKVAEIRRACERLGPPAAEIAAMLAGLETEL